MLCSVFGVCAILSGTPTAVDGDTIRFPQGLVRIAGIDAEELHEPNGEMARNVMHMLLANTKKVTCTPTSYTSYNRKVMTCRTHEGVDVGEYMVRSGWALDCETYSRRKYRRHEPAGARMKLIQKPYCNHRG